MCSGSTSSLQWRRHWKRLVGEEYVWSNLVKKDMESKVMRDLWNPHFSVKMKNQNKKSNRNFDFVNRGSKVTYVSLSHLLTYLLTQYRRRCPVTLPCCHIWTTYLRTGVPGRMGVAEDETLAPCKCVKTLNLILKDLMLLLVRYL